ncbi:MAG: putative oxidoreductase [Gemmatimonadetes bacterium]|nr:putative oxidoreductase [Gemmatimonadota bacterium]
MLQNPRARFAGLLAAGALLLVSACSRSDTPNAAAASATAAASAPALAPQVTSSPGEVDMPGATGAIDSLSTVADKARIRGAATAQVWLVEISDFQCPFCKEWHDKSFAIIDREYVKTGKIRVAYLNFPLTRIHPNAQAAAEAAMCAGVQGKFWELHESLFATQPKWAPAKSPLATFDSLARAAGVEPKSWNSCMSTHAMARLIEADRARSAEARVESTPTFFVGDRALAGAYPVDTFRVAIDQALAKAKAAP